jgi:hypothetical protein
MTTQIIMTPAIVKETGIKVFIHEGIQPKMSYNKNLLVVSKQPSSNAVFCIDSTKIVRI